MQISNRYYHLLFIVEIMHVSQCKLVANNNTKTDSFRYFINIFFFLFFSSPSFYIINKPLLIYSDSVFCSLKRQHKVTRIFSKWKLLDIFKITTLILNISKMIKIWTTFSQPYFRLPICISNSSRTWIMNHFSKHTPQILLSQYKLRILREGGSP